MDTVSGHPRHAWIDLEPNGDENPSAWGIWDDACERMDVMLEALESITTLVKGSKAQMENQIDYAIRTAKVAIRKAKGK